MTRRYWAPGYSRGGALHFSSDADWLVIGCTCEAQAVPRGGLRHTIKAPSVPDNMGHWRIFNVWKQSLCWIQHSMGRIWSTKGRYVRSEFWKSKQCLSTKIGPNVPSVISSTSPPSDRRRKRMWGRTHVGWLEIFIGKPAFKHFTLLMNSVTTAAGALPRAGTAVPKEVKEPPMGKGATSGGSGWLSTSLYLFYIVERRTVQVWAAPMWGFTGVVCVGGGNRWSRVIKQAKLQITLKP